jgi:lipopolysaccharide transport system permease protein
MVAVVEGFRWALLDKDAGLHSSVAVPIAVAIFFLVGGLYYFQSVEKTVADVV